MASTSASDIPAHVQELESSSRLFGELSLDGGAGESINDIDWDRTAGLAQRCADTLRSEQARTAWAQGQLIPVCGQLIEIGTKQGFLDPAIVRCMTQCCRVIGNIVLDHPTNRTKCLASRVPQRILGLLKALPPDTTYSDSPSLQATKAAIGALLNLTIDTPDVRQILLNNKAPDTVARCLGMYRISNWPHYPASQVRATTAEWTTKLLQELIQADDTMTSSTAHSLAQSILSLPVPPQAEFDNSASTASTLPSGASYSLLSSDLSILSLACELLEPHSYSDETVQEAFIAFPSTSNSTDCLLARLLDFVEHAELLPSWLDQVKIEQKRSAAAAAETKGESALDSDNEDEEEEEESLEVEKTFSTIKAGVARVVIAVCSNDRVMEMAFSDNGDRPGSKDGRNLSMSWVVKRAASWLESGKPDLIITGSTMLANLARTDSHCVKLLYDDSLAEPLARLLSLYASPSDPSTLPVSRPGEATQVLHGITGLLKNLAIPGQNKQFLCDAGVVEPCLALLRETLDMVVPLQTAAIGVLKHLCAGNVASALRVVLPLQKPGQAPPSLVVSFSSSSSSRSESEETPLNTIVDLANRTSDVRLKCEATRLLGNVIRSLYSSRSITSPITPSAMGGLETGLAKARARQILEKHTGTAEALAEMLRTGEKYPVLVNEAIVALTLLSTTEGGASMALKAVTKQHEVPTSPNPTSPEKFSNRQLPPMPSNTDAAADPLSPIKRSNAYTSRPTSRATSLGSRIPPPTALDILLRWLTEYAIGAEGMPAEMAGNALSLLETVYRSPDAAKEAGERGQKKELRIAEVQSVLREVVGRKAEGNAQVAVRETAARAAAALESMSA